MKLDDSIKYIKLDCCVYNTRALYELDNLFYEAFDEACDSDYYDYDDDYDTYSGWHWVFDLSKVSSDSIDRADVLDKLLEWSKEHGIVTTEPIDFTTTRDGDGLVIVYMEDAND